MCHRKYSWIFRNIPPSKLHNGTNGTHFHSNFLLILLDRLGNCASKLSIRCGIVVLCLGWTTLDIVWVFGQHYFHNHGCKKLCVLGAFPQIIMIMIMIFIYDPDNDPDLQCQDRANGHLSASNQRLHGNH